MRLQMRSRDHLRVLLLAEEVLLLMLELVLL